MAIEFSPHVGDLERGIELIEPLLTDLPDEKQFKALAIFGYLRLKRALNDKEKFAPHKARALELFKGIPIAAACYLRAKKQADQL